MSSAFPYQNQHFTGHFQPQFTYPGQRRPHPATGSALNATIIRSQPAWHRDTPAVHGKRCIPVLITVPQPCQLIPAGSGQKNFLSSLTTVTTSIPHRKSPTSVSGCHTGNDRTGTNHPPHRYHDFPFVRNTPPPASDSPASVLPVFSTGEIHLHITQGCYPGTGICCLPFSCVVSISAPEINASDARLTRHTPGSIHSRSPAIMALHLPFILRYHLSADHTPSCPAVMLSCHTSKWRTVNVISRNAPAPGQALPGPQYGGMTGHLKQCH